MTTFQQVLEKEIDKQMIDIKEFRKYHCYTINDKDSYNVKTLKKLHNQRYETFFKDHLEPHSTNGKISAIDANLLWFVFEDIRELPFLKFMKHIRPTNKELVDFWLKEFEKPIEELYMYGVSVVSSALSIVVDFYREWYLNQKYERIYSKGTNFDEWFALAKENQKLMENEEKPFDMLDFMEKARTIVAIKN